MINVLVPIIYKVINGLFEFFEPKYRLINHDIQTQIPKIRTFVRQIGKTPASRVIHRNARDIEN